MPAFLSRPHAAADVARASVARRLLMAWRTTFCRAFSVHLLMAAR